MAAKQTELVHEHGAQGACIDSMEWEAAAPELENERRHRVNLG